MVFFFCFFFLHTWLLVPPLSMQHSFPSQLTSCKLDRLELKYQHWDLAQFYLWFSDMFLKSNVFLRSSNCSLTSNCFFFFFFAHLVLGLKNKWRHHQQLQKEPPEPGQRRPGTVLLGSSSALPSSPSSHLHSVCLFYSNIFVCPKRAVWL